VTAPPGTAPLPDDPAVLKQMIAELLRELRQTRRDKEDVERRLNALLQRYYGPRPTSLAPHQSLLFPDALEAPPPPAAERADAAASEPPKKTARPHGRRRPAKELRRQQRRYELTPAERLCPECGHERQEIGAEVTQQYDYQPAEVFVIEHQRVKYACRCCEGNLAIAPKPPPPLDRALPGPGLLAQIVVDKYLDHLPLYRSESRYARLGVTLPRSTMCDGWRPRPSCCCRCTNCWRSG